MNCSRGFVEFEDDDICVTQLCTIHKYGICELVFWLQQTKWEGSITLNCCKKVDSIGDKKWMQGDQ